MRYVLMSLLALFAFSTQAAEMQQACVPGDTVKVICNTGTSNVTCPDGSVHPPGHVCPPPPSDSCPADTVRINMNVTTPGTQFTANYGGMRFGTIVVVAMQTGNSNSANNNLPSIAAAEYDGPPVSREAVL